jgi:hypothetical protein
VQSKSQKQTHQTGVGYRLKEILDISVQHVQFAAVFFGIGPRRFASNVTMRTRVRISGFYIAKKFFKSS